MAITAAHVARAPRIRLGMVGGGRDAFIGAVHRIAARLDDQYELVAGCFSSSAEKSMASGADLGIDPKRSYASFAEMARAEARKKDGIEAVAIVTPNHMHAPAAAAFLKAGIHVICDKPLTTSRALGEELLAVALELVLPELFEDAHRPIPPLAVGVVDGRLVVARSDEDAAPGELLNDAAIGRAEAVDGVREEPAHALAVEKTRGEDGEGRNGWAGRALILWRHRRGLRGCWPACASRG